MTIKTALKQWATRQKKYVVGYVASGNTLYGGGHPCAPVSTTDPMSLANARKKLADMPCAGCAIFKLVPVQVNR